MDGRRTVFEGWLLPVLLVLPQLLLTGFFFLWPAGEAIWSSLTREDPFGLGSTFVGLENFTDLFADPLYVDSIIRTVIFCAAVSVLVDERRAAARRVRRPRNPRAAPSTARC